jgi:hypothetical protein
MYQTYSIIEEDYYQNYEGQPYSSERIYRTMLTELEAKVLAAELNTTRVGNTYYSIRKERK